MSSLSPQSPELTPFHPWLLGHPSCKIPEEKQGEIQRAFQDSSNHKPIRAHVFQSGLWIFKREKPQSTLSNSQIHRISQIEKIRDYVTKYHLGDVFVVPEEYLYWDESKKEFVVVSQWVHLSQRVSGFYSEKIEAEYKTNEYSKADLSIYERTQNDKLKLGKSKEMMKNIQIVALVDLSFLGYCNHCYDNIHFQRDTSKIIIIDSTPTKKVVEERLFSNPFSYLLRDREVYKTIFGLTGTAKLKAFCSNDQVEMIDGAEKHKVLKATVIVIAQVALIFFAYRYLLPRCFSLLSSHVGNLAPRLTTMFIWIVKGLLITKGITLCANWGLMSAVWKLSRKIEKTEDSSGINTIIKREKNGYF